MKKHGGMLRNANRAAMAIAMGSLLAAPVAWSQGAAAGALNSNPQPLAVSGEKDNNFGPISVNVVVEGANDVQTHSRVKFTIQNDGDLPIVPTVEIYSEDNDTVPVGLATFSDTLFGLPPFLLPGDEAEASWEAGDDGDYTVKVHDLTGQAWNQSEFTVR